MNGFIITGLNPNDSIPLITSALTNILKDENNIISFNIGLEPFSTKANKYILNRPSYNLDFPICGINTDYLINSKLSIDDLAIIEGNLGIFNGNKINLNANGSPYHLSQRYNLPLVFIINSNDNLEELESVLQETKQQNNLIQGIIINKFQDDKNIDSIIKIIKESKIPLLGVLNIENINSINLEEINLNKINDQLRFNKLINSISKEITHNLDLEKLLKISKNKSTNFNKINPYNSYLNNYQGLRVGIASDEAFYPFYQDNIELLKDLGLEIIYFSPLKDKELPKDLDFLYISSGDIFSYLKELEDNYPLRHEINQELNNGLPCLAENDGLLYLLNKIKVVDTSYHMVSLFNIDSTLFQDVENVKYTRIYPSYPFNENLVINSKDIHNSITSENEMVSHIFLVKTDNEAWLDGLMRKNTIAYFPYINFSAEESGKEFLTQFLDLVKNENNN